MSRFLHFSKYVINTAHIAYISKKPTSYVIHFVDQRVDGFLIFGGGGVSHFSSTNTQITYCKQADPDDYAKLEQWIKGT